MFVATLQYLQQPYLSKDSRIRLVTEEIWLKFDLTIASTSCNLTSPTVIDRGCLNGSLRIRNNKNSTVQFSCDKDATSPCKQTGVIIELPNSSLQRSPRLKINPCVVETGAFMTLSFFRSQSNQMHKHIWWFYCNIMSLRESCSLHV